MPRSYAASAAPHSRSRGLHLAACMLFLGFIFAPLVSIVMFGADPHGQVRPLQPGLLVPRLKPRDAMDAQKGLAAELLERSRFRGELIGLRSRLAYHVLGYVDTSRIVSGRDGWLFWKEEFWGGRCIGDAAWTSVLNEIDTLAALAKPSGMKLVFAIAPDKSAIYPDMLHPRSAVYSVCKAENSARWRALAAERAPDLVDHAKALEPAKALGVPLFYRTDTHWNAVGAAFAARQLVAAALGIPAAELAAPVPAATAHRSATDMRGMLRLGGTELSPSPDPAVEARFVARATHDAIDTAIIHDSFYLHMSALLDAVFKGAQRFHITTLDGMDQIVLRNPSLLIVESVERSFPFRFGSGPYGLSGVLGQSIIANNRRAANRCVFDAANMVDALVPSQMAELIRDGRSFRATGSDPQITLALPEQAGRPTCIQLSLRVEQPAMLQIFLPARRGRTASSPFEAGRVIPVQLAAGENDVRLILPDDLTRGTIRIDPLAGVQDFAIESLAFGHDSGAGQHDITTSAVR